MFDNYTLLLQRSLNYVSRTHFMSMLLANVLIILVKSITLTQVLY